MSKFENNLTGGSVSKQLIRFSLPFLLTNFIQALYNVADMLIVSWFAGPDSVAGVSNGGQITLVIINFIVGITVGGTVLIAQFFGAKKYEEMKKTIGTMLTVLIILSFVLTVLIIALCEPILRLIQVPEEAFQEAKVYLNICMGGTIFIFGYNAISAILRGMGDSKRPLYFVSIACVINFILGLILAGPFQMGAAGVAYATVIAQAISLILSVIYLAKSEFIFDFKLKSFRIDKKILKLLLKIGVPNSIQNVTVGISFIFMMALVNGFGVYASAAMGIVGKFNGFAILPPIAMSIAVASMSAQNIGAGIPKRARETMICGIKIAFPIGLAFFLIAFFAPNAIMRIFTDNQEVIDCGVQYIRFFSIDYLIVPFMFCINGLLMGAGRTTFTMINGMLSSILLRVPFAMILGITINMGITGIGLAAPLSSLGALIIGYLYMRRGTWMRSAIETKTV